MPGNGKILTTVWHCICTTCDFYSTWCYRPPYPLPQFWYWLASLLCESELYRCSIQQYSYYACASEPGFPLMALFCWAGRLNFTTGNIMASIILSLKIWQLKYLVFWGTSGLYYFQMDSIISQNTKFWGPVDHMKKTLIGNPALKLKGTETSEIVWCTFEFGYGTAQNICRHVKVLVSSTVLCIIASCLKTHNTSFSRNMSVLQL